MKCGRARWQEAEETRKTFNIVLIRQDKKFLISELFKVIQNVISLILHYRTMLWFRTVSSRTFITSDAINLRSIINSGLIPGGKNLSKRQTVFFLLTDPIDKEHKNPEKIDLGVADMCEESDYLEKMMERLNSGESRLCSRPFCVSSTFVWWKVQEQHGKRRRNQERFQYCTDALGEILYFRAL